MTDIVEGLRNLASFQASKNDTVINAGADEIERLRAALKEIAEYLKPGGDALGVDVFSARMVARAALKEMSHRIFDHEPAAAVLSLSTSATTITIQAPLSSTRDDCPRTLPACSGSARTWGRIGTGYIPILRDRIDPVEVLTRYAASKCSSDTSNRKGRHHANSTCHQFISRRNDPHGGKAYYTHGPNFASRCIAVTPFTRSQILVLNAGGFVLCSVPVFQPLVHAISRITTE
jgi:hypothetical protein